jgi:phosphohistidine swiveling domain-containing protein
MEQTILDKTNKIILKQGIPDLSKQKLSKIVRRENSALFDSFLRIGATLRNKDLEFDNRMHFHIVLDHDVYSSEEDFNNLKKEMVEKAKKDSNFLNRYFQIIFKDTKEVIEWSKKQKQDFSKLTNKELLQIYNQFTQKGLDVMSHLWPVLGPEEYILEEVGKRLSKYIDPKTDFNKFQKTLDLMITSTKQSTLNIKKEKMLKAAISKNQEEIKKLQKEIAWEIDIQFKFKYQTLEQLNKEIKQIENPKEQLDKLQKDQEQLKKSQKQTIQKYNFDKELLNLCQQAQTLPHIRFARIECLVESAYYLKDFFEELKKRLKIEITQAYYWEITQLLEGEKIDLNKIKEKSKTHSFILIDHDFYDYDLETSNKIKKQLDSNLNIEGEIKGQTACMGKAKGKCKVLHSAKEISRVEKGDILVTSMTTPDYVPAMEKAAAFITDEGGLSCHAAIVAREMNKPCIIGTKIATKALKDNDVVEVDADNGTVKKC